jgi:hypothetical protein
MVHPQRIAHMIEQLARPRRLGKLLFFPWKSAYSFRANLRKMPTVLLHLPPIFRGNPKK